MRFVVGWLLVLGLGSLAHAGPITVDGSLADWGVVVADGNASNINAYAGMAGIGLQGWFSEDNADGSGLGAFLGPNYGGQKYDAEFLAAAVQGSTLYIAIVTGQRPDNGFSYYGPGDIRIVTDSGEYGIEVGGGAGGGAGSALVETDPGSTYSLSGGGITLAHAALAGLQRAGSLWEGPVWINDPIVPQGPTQINDQIAGGTFSGWTDYVYTRNTLTTQHAVIELSVDLNLFNAALGNIQSIHWRPSCGNDEVNLYGLDIPVPEPATLTLAGLGLAGLVLRRRRRSI